jgi:NitT/TauT family transport system substrate-binding protein
MENYPMSKRHRSSLLLLLCSLLGILAFLLAACGGSTTAPAPKKVSIGLGYVPDIQFSPFYVAKSKGYYREVGLDVSFNQGIIPDLIGSLVAGKNNYVFASGDELLVARDKKVKAINVATVFQKYPVSLVVPADSPIRTPADLKGHSVGVPGPYGATYIGLQAILYKANLSLSDIRLQSIGFTQVAALASHRVDAVMGYANNEPLKLKKSGFNVRTFNVSDYLPLISNGIVTTEETYRSQQQEVRNFVQATLKGLKDVIANPSEAVQLSKSYVPGLTDTTGALEVLQATIPLWQGKGQPGLNDSASWKAMEQFMVTQKMIAPVSDLAQAYTNQAVV